MKYNELTITKAKKSTRVGRGIAAGKGKTAGRGTKGQGSRKSGGVRPGFEGGQMPLYMRIPKLRGFKSKRPDVENVNTGQLEKLKGAKVDNHSLAEAGLISSPHVVVKLISGDDLTAKKDVSLQLASASAIKAVEKAGGSFSIVPQVGRVAKKPKTDKE
jgi:large subunit ribosomal protein L15